MHKHGLRALALSLMAALGLMAFAAAGAQAENLTGTAGTFLVLGAAATTASPNFTGEQEGAGKLLVSELGLTIECAEGFVLEGKFLGSTGKEALAKILFKKCVTREFAAPNGELPCTIKTTGSEAKDITATTIVLPVLHNEKHYLIFHPDVGEAFAEIKLEGAECPVSLSNSVTGLVAAEVLEALTATNRKVIHFSSAIQELLAATLKFGKGVGAKKAIIDGLGKGSLLGGVCTFTVV